MPPTPSTTVSRKFSQFLRSFWTTGSRKNFWKSSLRCCDRFRPIFVQIGAILAIFRPFEIFGVEFLPNFERPFTPRGWLRSARNFAKTRFRRFPTFDFSTPQNFVFTLVPAPPPPPPKTTRGSKKLIKLFTACYSSGLETLVG